MARVRKNIASLGPTWNPTMLWYARGVGAMQQRPLNDQLGWRFIGAMHDFEERDWKDAGILRPQDVMPSKSAKDKYWGQCQHGTWLADIEKLALDEIA